MAPWIPSVEDSRPNVGARHHSLRRVCHSNVGFLRADSNCVKLVGEAMTWRRVPIISISPGTATSFVNGSGPRTRARAPTCPTSTTWMPTTFPGVRSAAARIGAFGATRPLKNFASAAGAVLEISRRYKTNLELWISAERTDGGGDTNYAPRSPCWTGSRAGKWSRTLVPVPPERRAHASVVAAQLHRVVQHGNGRRRGGARTGFGSLTPSGRRINGRPSWMTYPTIARVGRYLLTGPYAKTGRAGRTQIPQHRGLKIMAAFLSF
jgi:hypothetical protein